MKKSIALISASILLACAPAAFAQPGGHQEGANVPGMGRRWVQAPDPDYVAYSTRGTSPFVFGGDTKAQGRSFNNAPTFFVYPASKLDSAAAAAFVRSLGMQKQLDENFAPLPWESCASIGELRLRNLSAILKVGKIVR